MTRRSSCGSPPQTPKSVSTRRRINGRSVALPLRHGETLMGRSCDSAYFKTSNQRVWNLAEWGGNLHALHVRSYFRQHLLRDFDAFFYGDNTREQSLSLAGLFLKYNA